MDWITAKMFVLEHYPEACAVNEDDETVSVYAGGYLLGNGPDKYECWLYAANNIIDDRSARRAYGPDIH